MREIQTGDGLLKGIFTPGECGRVSEGDWTHLWFGSQVQFSGNFHSCLMFGFLKQPKSPHQRDSTRLIAEPHQPTLKSGSGFGSGGAACSRPGCMASWPPASCDLDLRGATHYVHVQYLTGRHSYFMPIRFLTQSCRSLLSLHAEVV